MGKKFYKGEKFQAVFFPVLYFALAVALMATGCYIFKKNYYQPVVVDGTSMLPTLSGGKDYLGSMEIDGHTVQTKYRYMYGIADLHENSVNNIKRFDVIVTHYPKSWGPQEEDYIIKRVWGFPGETVQLTYDDTKSEFTFTASKQGKATYKITAPVVEYTREFETECVYNNKYYFSKASENFIAAKFELPKKTFYTKIRDNSWHRRAFRKELKKNEYFVMGDNWCVSNDSYGNINNPDLLYKKLLLGRVIYISSYASLVKDNPTYFHEFTKRYNF